MRKISSTVAVHVNHRIARWTRRRRSEVDCPHHRRANAKVVPTRSLDTGRPSVDAFSQTLSAACGCGWPRSVVEVIGSEIPSPSTSAKTVLASSRVPSQ